MALLPQTFGRCFFGFFTMPLAQNGSPLVFLCIFMFCIVESFRYAFYFLKSNGKDESLIGKLFGLIRYNSFLICYPLGAGSECLVVYEVAKRIRKEMPDRLSIRMPNKVNFAFDMTYCMYFMIVLYGAVFPKLYSYLLRQRKAYMEGFNKNKKE
jgi:very-long-chain (3R)-3-hydroxyacyl-CoA dehydratase